MNRALDECEVKTQNAQGESISYTPKRYNFDYKFEVELKVDHPWVTVPKIEFGSRKTRISISEYPGFSLSTFDPRVDSDYCELETYYRKLVAYMNLAKEQMLEKVTGAENEPREGKMIEISPEMLDVDIEQTKLQVPTNSNVTVVLKV